MCTVSQRQAGGAGGWLAGLMRKQRLIDHVQHRLDHDIK
jgi:hypothetical protein